MGSTFGGNSAKIKIPIRATHLSHPRPEIQNKISTNTKHRVELIWLQKVYGLNTHSCMQVMGLARNLMSIECSHN